jgi:hypothetical protein
LAAADENEFASTYFPQCVFHDFPSAKYNLYRTSIDRRLMQTSDGHHSVAGFAVKSIQRELLQTLAMTARNSVARRTEEAGKASTDLGAAGQWTVDVGGALFKTASSPIGAISKFNNLPNQGDVK